MPIQSGNQTQRRDTDHFKHFGFEKEKSKKGRGRMREGKTNDKIRKELRSIQWVNSTEQD